MLMGLVFVQRAFHQLGAHFLQGTEPLHRDGTLVCEYGLTPQLRAMPHAWTIDPRPVGR